MEFGRRQVSRNRFKSKKLGKLMAVSLLSGAIGTLVGFPAAYGQDADQKGKALEEIEAAADRLCTTVPIKQTNSGTQLTAQGKAQVNNLIAKIVDLGLSASAEHYSNESSGVLQKDLAAAIKETDTCKIKVLQLLLPSLLGPAPATTEANQTSPPSGDHAPAPQRPRPEIIPPTSGSYWAVSVPSRAGGTISCEVLTSFLDEADTNRVLKYLGATRQDNSLARPECSLSIFSIGLSNTSGPNGCPAREATLRYALRDNQQVLTNRSEATNSVHYSECYGAEESTTDLNAIRGAVDELAEIVM